MLIFAKFTENEVNQLGNAIKAAMIEAAVLACDSHPWIGKAEFSVLCMKFGNNPVIKKTVDYLEKKISKMLDFDQEKSVFIEKASPFTELVMRMKSEQELINGVQIEALLKAIDEKISIEKKRIVQAREAKTESTISSDGHAVSVYKTEAEVLLLDKCYEEALAEVAPGIETRGLSALEFCTMCIYYDN